MSGTLVFLGWHRSGVYALANASAGSPPRLEGTVQLELRDRDGGGSSAANNQFKIMGPGDVQSLNAKAFVRMAPPPHTTDAEMTKCVHVELAAADLPWRYTPELASGQRLRPWIVLVVGTAPEAEEEGEITLLPGNKARLHRDVTNDHALSGSANWAHVQINLQSTIDQGDLADTALLQTLIDNEGGKPIARLLSPRQLLPNKPYIAAVVPAFKPDGARSWVPGVEAIVPVYHHWRFRTGDAGDFRTLSARLHKGPSDPELGRAPLDYNRLDPPIELSVRGALAPIDGTDAQLAPAVRDDTAALTDVAQTDERGRKVISPPVYGSAWVEDTKATTWGETANNDPRHRGSAGVGTAAAIVLQDTIVDTVNAQAGAIANAAQRVRFLTMGLAAAGSLWNRRLPVDSMRRLQLYGPAMRRMVTNNGTVLGQITAVDRPLPPALFSSAARRVLRSGPARGSLAQKGANDAANVLPQANSCPPDPERAPGGLPHADVFAEAAGLPPLEEFIKEAIGSRELNRESILEIFMELVDRAGPEVQDIFEQFEFFHGLENIINDGRLINYDCLLELLILITVEKQDIEQIAHVLRTCSIEGENNDPIIDFGEDLLTPKPNRPCRPVNLGQLEGILTDAIDPTKPDAWMTVRVLNTIEGLDDQPLTPPEICTGVDLPVWQFLQDTAPDWLLPGVGQLAADSVYAFESNPTFIDAFLLGLNEQTLGELRWRNIPIASGCTPLKMFWGRTDVDVTQRQNDIRDVGNWETGSSLGDPTHLPAGLNNSNLVLVFRSDLFRRYPTTLVSAVRANLDGGGSPDFEEGNEPDENAPRSWPVFQGTMGEDVTFFGFSLTPDEARDFWFVLEEPPSGYRFRSDSASTPNDGAAFAENRLNDPTRVMIRGGLLID